MEKTLLHIGTDRVEGMTCTCKLHMVTSHTRSRDRSTVNKVKSCDIIDTITRRIIYSVKFIILIIIPS